MYLGIYSVKTVMNQQNSKEHLLLGAGEVAYAGDLQGSVDA